MTHTLTLAFFLVLALSANLVVLVRQLGRRRLIDVPNERSSHKIPTPRGGGIAIVLSFLAAVVWMTAAGSLDMSLAAALVLGGGLVAAVGLLDDLFSLRATPRLLAQSAAAVIGVALIGNVERLQLGGWIWDLGLMGGVLTVIGLVWLINLTNFMDGIDGLVGSHTVFVAGAGAGLCWLCGLPDQAALLAILTAATLGFLLFNWPPGGIFMGDVASGFLGLVVGLVAVDTSGSVTLWAWGVLMTPFIADATVTRAVRIARYGDWTGAHRSHVYQRLARAWHGHAPVVHAYWIVALLAVLPLAVWAALMPQFGWAIMAGAWVAAFSAAFVMGGGREDHHGREPAAADRAP